MAVAAVLSPLLLIFGLKYGTIETLRFRLVQDPRNREIRPLVSKSFAKTWIEDMRRRADVGFIIPMTRQISATVMAAVKERPEKKYELDIIPTAEGDILVLENHAPIPRLGECVLSQFAAEALQVQPGETLVVTATRTRGGQAEAGSMELKVVGVLSVRANDRRAVYVPLDILEAVEQFKDGQAVPEFGWTGSTPKAYPQYDGLIVVVPQELSKIEQYNLVMNTGFTKVDAITLAELMARTALQVEPEQVAPGMALYMLSTEKKPVGEESVASVRYKLRGKDATLLPWIAPITARILTESGTGGVSVNLLALSVDPHKAEAVHLTPVPSWEEAGAPLKIILPASLGDLGAGLSLQVPQEKDFLTFPIAPVPERAAGQVAFIPAPLAGILRLSQLRGIAYEKDAGEFVLSRRGYAGFRLYAKTIDTVDGLRQYFESESIPVHTEARRIKDVVDLDRYLTLIFWLIATVGIIGGVLALLASLYASVERKKRELSVLRLIGLSGPLLFRYPIYQGMLIGTGGFVVALVFFTAIATTINTLFSAHLAADESFCRLPIMHAISALGVTIVVAILAATVAAWRVTQIEPAEALRDE
jgi:putative ABC transport system permease protein